MKREAPEKLGVTASTGKRFTELFNLGFNLEFTDSISDTDGLGTTTATTVTETILVPVPGLLDLKVVFNTD